MNTVLTTIGFFVVTVICVWRYLNVNSARLQAGGQSRGTVLSSVRCANCNESAPRGSTYCPACGTLRGSVESVPVSASTHDSSSVAELAVVLTEQCVGCGTWFDACPLDGAI